MRLEESGPVVQPGIPTNNWAEERPVCKFSPDIRKVAGPNPARSTIENVAWQIMGVDLSA